MIAVYIKQPFSILCFLCGSKGNFCNLWGVKAKIDSYFHGCGGNAGV